ncbi:hypothetical protein ACQCT6_08270 [Cytobacillus gottheilii]|uniref:hypothetical protein n=1 Tax=Cytobacillus gottheilii TaxID=859144 RepID=UPI003CF68157
MKKTVLSICILSGSLFFSPVQLSEAHVQSTSSNTENIQNNVHAAETKVLSKTSSSSLKLNAHPDIKTLKEMSNPTHSKDEIISTFGEPADVLRGAMDNNLLWRYDYKNDENYVFTHDLDAIDVDALKSGELEYVIYISFEQDEQTVNSIAIYYIDQDGKFHEYREYADGYVKDLVE